MSEKLLRRKYFKPLTLNFSVISSLSIVLPALFAAILFRRLNRTLKLLAYFLFITVAVEGIALALYQKSMNDLFLFHAYTYLELGFISAIFYRLSPSSKWCLIIKLFMAGFVIFSVFNLIYFEGVFEFNANQRYLESMIILVLCVGYFIELIHSGKHIYLKEHAYFWLASSYMIYFAGNSLLFLFYNRLDNNEMYSYWDLHSILNLCLNLGITGALWMGRKALI